MKECVAKAFCPVERYGFEAESHWRISNLRHEGSVTHWTLERGGVLFGEMTLPMAGEHMR